MGNIDVVEDGDTRVVLHIHPARDRLPGGWNMVPLINILFAGIASFFGYVAAQGLGAVLPTALVIAGLVAVRSIVTFQWLAMKYGHTLILLDGDRIVVRKILSIFRRTQEAVLGPTAHVSLVEEPNAARIDSRPVYHVEVGGVTGRVRFGRSLPKKDQEWLVRRIAQFIATIIDRQIPDGN